MSPSNITTDGQRFRLFFGILLFFFCLGFIGLFTVSDFPLPMRVIVFIPAWMCFLFLFQAFSSTCVFLAARGARATAQGTEQIEDAQLVDLLKARAGRIHLHSLLAAALYTLMLVAASVLIPWKFDLHF